MCAREKGKDGWMDEGKDAREDEEDIDESKKNDEGKGVVE